MLSPVAVDAALGRIRPHVRTTPVLEHDGVVLKLEALQHSGSFKVRGAFNSALAQGIPEAGLIAASGGNHGAAVAHVARALGSRAEIFVPETASPAKIAKIRALGGEVRMAGRVYADAQAACDERIAESGALAIHPYDQPLTVAGQATLGREIAAQVPDVDTVVVAVGGGGLAAGVAAALPHVRIITVEPEGAPTLHAALVAGAPVAVDIDSVAADSLGATTLGALPWRLLADRATPVLVDDAAIVAARRDLWDRVQLTVEHGGATAWAALRSGAWRPEPGSRTVVIVCGANTDPGDLVVSD